jgi:hypothetical protein
MSRTKKSGSMAHRANSASTKPGLAYVPTASAAGSRVDASSALNAPSSLMSGGFMGVELIWTTSPTQ